MTLEMLQTFWSAQDGKRRARKCGLLLLCGAIFAFLLPFDSEGDLDFVVGAGEWFAHVIILMLSTGTTGRFLFPRMIAREIPIPAALVLYSAINAVPVFLMTLFFDLLLTSYEDPVGVGGEQIIWWMTESFVFTGLVIGLLSIVAAKFEFEQEDMQAVEPARPGQKFFNRLSPEVAESLLCLEMEDHYVRVHAAEGSALLHMRMSDAIAELGDFSGLQVHRSWWVAVGAIEAVTKQNRDYKIRLRNGLVVPVSRSRVSALRDQGLL